MNHNHDNIDIHKQTHIITYIHRHRHIHIQRSPALLLSYTLSEILKKTDSVQTIDDDIFM
jgi:hypothetical protein